jgi:hypothetical protein
MAYTVSNIGGMVIERVVAPLNTVRGFVTVQQPIGRYFQSSNGSEPRFIAEERLTVGLEKFKFTA